MNALHPPWKLLMGIGYAYPDFLGGFLHDPHIRVFNLVTLQLIPHGEVTPDNTFRIMETPNATFAQLLSQLPSDWKPDAIIWIDQLMHYSLPTDISECPYPTAWMIGDWSNRLPYCLQYASAFDFILGDQQLISLLTKKGFTNVAHFFSISFSPQRLYPQPEREDKYDLAFIGNIAPEWRGERNHYLYRLAKLGSRYRVLIADHIAIEDYPSVLNQCKIVFNWGHNQVNNLRAYEVPACGRLLFMEEDNLELPQMLPPDAYVTYNESNLEERLIYYLTHDTERQAIAQAGYRHIQNCTYERQFYDLLNLVPRIVENFGKRQRTFQHLPQVQQDIIKSRMLSGLHTVGASIQSVWQLGRRYWPQYNWQLKTLPYISPEEMIQTAPADMVNELAVCLLEVIHHNGLEPGDAYLTNLASIAHRILSCLCDRYPEPIYHYNLAWSCEILGQQEQALQIYFHLLDLLKQSPQLELDIPGKCGIPIGKGTFFGFVSTILFLEWQRAMLRHVHQDLPPAERYTEYGDILAWQAWSRIGVIKRHFHLFNDAQWAFEQAIACYARNYLPYLQLFTLSVIQHHYKNALYYAQIMQRKQPIHPEFYSWMATLPVHEFAPRELLPLFRNALDFLHVYHALPDIKRQLEKQYCLTKLLDILQHNPTRQALIHALSPHYSAALYQSLCELSPHLEHPWLKKLCEPFPFQWAVTGAEIPPHLAESTGFYTVDKAPIVIDTGHHPTGYQRVYSQTSDLARKVIGPDRLPYLFPQVMCSADSEIDGLWPDSLLIIATAWESVVHPAWLQTILDLCAQRHVVLWFPAALDERDICYLEACLDEQAQSHLLILLDDLGLEQQHFLLRSAACVWGTAESSNWFYLWWALSLGTPVGFWSTVDFNRDLLLSIYPIEPDDLARFIIDSAQDGAHMMAQVSVYHQLAQAIALQLQDFYPTTAEQKLCALLWELKLSQ